MRPEEEKDKAQWRKETFDQIKAELEANPVFQKMLERAYPNNRQSFVEEYAGRKVHWMEYAEHHRKWLEREDLQWVEKANDCLDQILQKKLFDAQCLWRAEQLEIKEVDVTMDFIYWQQNIRACPFIAPIEQADLDIYMQYLQSSNFEMELGFLQQWQDHEGITEAYRSDEGHVPEWYEFHNSRTGLGIYMTLPDIRREKEEFYLGLWRQKHKQDVAQRVEAEAKAKAENPDAPTPPDKLPMLNFHVDGWMKWFVETFEDKDTIAAFRSNAKSMRDSDEDEQLEDDLRLLARADRPVPMQGWFDWKEAVHRAADSYGRIRIMEAMPDAFEQYRLHIELGLGFEISTDRSFGWNDGYREAILIGRDLNGEPMDFNF
jgi:hypothetical protein